MPKPAVAATAPPAGQWMRTGPYMAAVDATQWREFLASHVTPRFPDGFTVQNDEDAARKDADFAPGTAPLAIGLQQAVWRRGHTPYVVAFDNYGAGVTSRK